MKRDICSFNKIKLESILKKSFYFPNVHKMLFCNISFQVTHVDSRGKHRVFIMETFIKNESVTATQRAIPVHSTKYGFGRHDPLPTRNTVLLWVNNFRAPGSGLKWNYCHSTSNDPSSYGQLLWQCADNNSKPLNDVNFKTK